MVKPMQNKSIDDLRLAIPKIVEEIPYLKLLVLFGSRARGDDDTKSDWDFAFSCDEELRKQYENGGWDAYRIWGILQQVYELRDNQVDIVELKNCSDILAHLIAKDGKVIYEQQPGNFLKFQQQALLSKEQVQLIRRKQQESIQAILKEIRQ